MKQFYFFFAIFVTAIISLFLVAFQIGLSAGQSQCYPYAVPYSEAQGQGGSK